ncbi:MAG: DNA polymerase I [Planctomycetaceae bacterium]|nr:DNA polymerase I [Planctomycetaceae bacterium]
MAARNRQTVLPGLEGVAPEPSPAGRRSRPAAGAAAAETERQPTARVVPGTPATEGAGTEGFAFLPPTGLAAQPDGKVDLAGKRVWVVDAFNLIFQVFHAIPEMTGPQGEPLNAVFGFTRDMLFLIEQQRPDYLFCAFDMPGGTFREKIFADYKMQRAAMPDELVPQIGVIGRMLAALQIPVLGVEGYEADDVMATVARIVAEGGGECVLVTGDKDCRQLITERVRVYNVRKQIYYDAAALAAEWGVRPDQVVDFQALVGDKVDNVPGVPLIGPKVAGELLAKYGTLDALFEHVDELPKGKRRDNLIEHRERALMSRDLVRLDAQVELPLDWNRGQVAAMQIGPALPLFLELGFHAFAEKARAAGRAGTPAAGWQADYRTVDTPQAFAAFLAELRQQRSFSFDTETTNVNPAWADLVGISCCWEAGVAYYLPIRAPEGEAHLDCATVIAALRPILEDPAIEKIGQNLKYDAIVLRGLGVRLAGIACDTMIASYLLDAGERNHNLDELAKRYFDHQTIKITELIGVGKQQKRMDEVSTALVGPYAAEDADVPWRLAPLLRPKLVEWQAEKLFREVELPLVDVLADMEHTGIRVDVPRLRELSAEYGRRLAALETEIFALAGCEFNIASPKQLQKILFDDLKLPAGKRTKTGPSTDAEVLEDLARLHPLPAKIVEHRQYAKLQGTYVDALPELINPKTGRVHCSFNQTVAATGRLSSSDPNLQNIPVRGEAGREIRSAFLPGSPGWVLLTADYSQIELRVLAHFSQDTTLAEAFARDEDIHTLVASQVYGVGLDAVTREMRYGAKAVNFGVIYGQSAFGLAKQVGTTPESAAEFIDAYFSRYPGVEEFLVKVLEECQAQGYVETILGRRRAIRGVRVGAGRQRNLPERTAVNTVIQGSAADLIKLAMVAIHRRLRREQLATRLLLQIHDELVFEVPVDEVAAVAKMVAEEMTGVLPLRVPLKVDLKAGPHWAGAEALA